MAVLLAIPTILVGVVLLLLVVLDVVGYILWEFLAEIVMEVSTHIDVLVVLDVEADIALAFRRSNINSSSTRRRHRRCCCSSL